MPVMRVYAIITAHKKDKAETEKMVLRRKFRSRLFLRLKHQEGGERKNGGSEVSGQVCTDKAAEHP